MSDNFFVSQPLFVEKTARESAEAMRHLRLELNVLARDGSGCSSMLLAKLWDASGFVVWRLDSGGLRGQAQGPLFSSLVACILPSEGTIRPFFKTNDMSGVKSGQPGTPTWNMERLLDAAHSREEADFRPCNSRVIELQRQYRPL